MARTVCWATCRRLIATGCAQSRYRTTTTSAAWSGRAPTTLSWWRTGARTCLRTASTSMQENRSSSPRVSICYCVLTRATLCQRRYYNYMAPRLSVTETVNTFKNRLDKFWSDQEVLCCKIDLHGIGNRSIV